MADESKTEKTAEAAGEQTESGAIDESATPAESAATEPNDSGHGAAESDAAETDAGHDHAGHDHAGHDHAGHDHDHAGHDHDHAGHDHDHHGGGGHGGHGSHGSHGERAPEDNYRIDDLGAKVAPVLLGVGVLGLLAGAGIGATVGWQQFFHGYLVAYTWVLSLVVGALWWVTLQHLVNAKWCIVVRRTMECFAMTMPVMGVLALPLVVPVFMGSDLLFPWAGPGAAAALGGIKPTWFSLGFFGARFAVYFAFWSLLALYWFRGSLSTGETGNESKIDQMRQAAAPAMMGMALTITFAAIDLIMSLDPTWFSTIFGVYYFAGAVVGVHSLLALVLMWLQSQGRLTKSVTVHHFHDLGKMMFAFTVFWAYIGFSQFMLIWYANMPEETAWYRVRMGITAGGDGVLTAGGEVTPIAFNGWAYVSIALVVGHFALPFIGLLSRRFKRNKLTLGFWAVWILAACYLDQYWLVTPQLSTRGVTVGGLDLAVNLLLAVGMLGTFLGAAALVAASAKVLLPLKDPRLPASLAFENI